VGRGQRGMLGWRRQGKADADDADAGTHGEGATAHEPSARPAAATQQVLFSSLLTRSSARNVCARQVRVRARAHTTHPLLTDVLPRLPLPRARGHVQQAGQGAENTAKPGFFARRQVAPAASAHDSQRSLLTAVRAGSQGDVGHKSILRALQEAPHIAPSPGQVWSTRSHCKTVRVRASADSAQCIQLSRWWVLEFLDYEPAEAHPIAPTHDGVPT